MKLKFNRSKIVACSLAAVSLLASVAAHAEIDASVGTALTAVQADASALSALVVPIVVAVMGLGIVIKLIKRFGNKI